MGRLNTRSNLFALCCLMLRSKVSLGDDGIDWFKGAATSYGRRGKLNIEVPAGAAPGDTLVVMLSRSDGPLPLELDGFNTSKASCFKSDNEQSSCFHLFNDCVRFSSNGEYCASFGNGHRGFDLATVVYTQVITSVGLRRSPLLKVDLTDIRSSNNHPAWAVVVAVRGLSFDDPVRSYAGVSCDKSSRSKFAQIPKGGANDGDPLLLSMAFDDAVPDPTDFSPPDGTRLIGYISGNDEAGLVYGATLNDSTIKGPLSYVTVGEGGPNCKDELLTVVLRPSDGTDSITLEELEMRAEEEEARRKTASSAPPIMSPFFSSPDSNFAWTRLMMSASILLPLSCAFAII